jgi:spore coat-associated protein N
MAATSRKILVPLATVLAAGAIAVGSGATFTSQSGNTLSAVTSGTLSQLNSKDGAAIFDLADVKPGDTLDGSLSLTNTGTLPARFGLTEATSTNGFSGSNLTLQITNTTTGVQVYNGTFGGLADGVRNDLGVVQPGVRNDYRFTVKLAQDAPNTEQGKTAGATFQWDSVQLDGATSNQG